MKRVRCVYDKDHMYVLRIENTSESDPHSYEATGAVALRKPRKNSEASTILSIFKTLYETNEH